MYVLTYGLAITQRMREGSDEVQTYLKEQFSRLLNDPTIEEGIYCQLEPRFATTRTERILQLLTDFARS